MLLPPLRALLLGLAVAAALAPAGAVRAQCAEGRVSTPEMLGRCCWPGQTFSESSGRCAGPPECPAPLVAEGDSCVAPLMSGVYGGGPYGEAPPIAAGALAPWGESELPPPAERPSPALEWPAEPRTLRDAMIAPRLERGTDELLLVAGLATFAAGYIGAIAIGVADESARNCLGFDRFTGSGSVGCESWPYAFVPIIGGVLAGTVVETENACCRNSAIGWGFGIPVALIQSLGLVITGVAAFGRTEVLVPAAPDEGWRISLAPYVSDTEAGTWLRIAL